MMFVFAFVSVVSIMQASASPRPAPEGRLVDLGGQRIHVHCTGRGQPTVVIETGLGDFSFDWILVERAVARLTRVCTYDRGGYAWSDPGPMPRTFAQLNLEMRTALLRAGEREPYLLVGHSFGGGVVRAFALQYPRETAGLVFVDIISEHQYIRMGTHAGRIGDDAKGRVVPTPRIGSGASKPLAPAAPVSRTALESPYDLLPQHEQDLHAWAAAQPALEEAENSQREWSGEYFARWAATSQTGSLGALPLIVLTRASGGYGDSLDKPAEELEGIRLDAQSSLARLSTAGIQRIVPAGHNMHLEKPEVVVTAIHDLLESIRKR
jgi:pimeloyl-ACP methyl ester carboxylesterase